MIVKIFGVYCFTYRPDGRKYVGSGLDCHGRRKSHVSKAKAKSGDYFQKQLSLLEIENFDFEILEECDPIIRLEREKHYIILFNSVYPNGFNMIEDPTRGWDYLFTAAIRKRLSDARKLRVTKQETRDKISLAMKGRKFSEETINRMLIASTGHRRNVGRKMSDEEKVRISKLHKGKVYSEETRRKISIATIGNKRRLGKRHGLETRLKISTAGKGNKNCLGFRHTKDSRRKMSQWQIGRKLQTKTIAKMVASRALARKKRKLSAQPELFSQK